MMDECWILLQFLRRLWGRRRVVCGGGWLHLSEEFGIVGFFLHNSVDLYLMIR